MDQPPRLIKRELQRRVRDYGVRVTDAMVDWYERKGLIHEPVRIGLGRGKGIRREYAAEDLRTLVAVPVVLRYCHRSLDLATVAAWALHGSPVPWPTVRASLERVISGPLAQALRSPDKVTNFLLYGWLGQIVVPGRGAPKKARIGKVVREILQDPRSPEPAATTFGLVEGLAPKIGINASLSPSQFTDYDPVIGQWASILDRFISLRGIMKSTRTATEKDAEEVRPTILWTMTTLFAIRNLLDQKSRSSSARAARQFAYTTSALVVALLLHAKRDVPPAMWETILKLPELLRPFVPENAEDEIRDYPFRRFKQA